MERLQKHSTVARAYLLMQQSHRAHLPVYDGSRIVGVVSGDDIKRAVASKGDIPLLVENFMRSPVRTLQVEQDFDPIQALKKLLEEDVAEAWIVSKQGQPGDKEILLREEILKLLTDPRKS